MTRAASGAGSELHYDFTGESGLFVVWGASNLAELASGSALVKGDSGAGSQGVIPLLEGGDPSGFYSGAVYPDLTLADWEDPINDDEPLEVMQALSLFSTNYPQTLVAGEPFPLHVEVVNGYGHADYEGVLTLALLDALNEPLTNDYSIAPSTLTIQGGYASGTVTISTEADLSDVYLGASIDPLVQGLGRMASTPFKPVDDGAKGYPLYVDNSGTFGHPLKNTVNINGSYGEWPGGHKTIHLGLDLRAAVGTTVHAAKKGVVCFSGSDAMSVSIYHGNNMVTKYTHVKRLAGLKVGSVVNKGDPIATTALRGTTSPHLHYELRTVSWGQSYKKDAYPGVAISPLSYAHDPPLVADLNNGPEFKMVWITRDNPGQKTLTLTDKTAVVPKEDAIAVMTSPYFTVGVADLRGGNTVAPDAVKFSDETASVLSQYNAVSLSGLDLATLIQQFPKGSYSRLPLEESQWSGKVYKSVGYKYYSSWDTTKFRNEPVGARNIVITATSISNESTDLVLTFGPTLEGKSQKRLPEMLSLCGGVGEFDFDCRGQFGPFPNSPAANTLLDQIEVKVTAESASDWEVLLRSPTGLESRTLVIDLRVFDARFPLALKVRQQDGSKAAKGIVTIEASSKRFPDIRHRHRIEVTPQEGDFAPESLPVGTVLSFKGGVHYPFPLDSAESSSFSVTSATTFQGGPFSGTYVYSKTSPTTGRIQYNGSYAGQGYSETEQGDVTLTFRNRGVGTYVSAGAYSGIKDGISYSGPFQGEGIFHYPTDRCSDLAPQTLEVGALVGFSGKSIDSSNRLELSSSSFSIVSDDSFQSGTVHGSYGYSKSGENEAVFSYDFSYAEEGYAETERGIVRLIFTELTGGVFSSAGNYEGVIGDDPFSGGFDGWGLFTYSPASGSLQLISAP